MNRGRQARLRRFAGLALSVGLLLRVMVPAGLMPADTDSGWYLKICPDGMPVAVMVAVFGDQHAHHHHHDGGHSDHSTDYQQCDLGSALAADAATGGYQGLTNQLLAVTADAVIWLAPTTAVRTYALLPRAPPLSG